MAEIQLSSGIFVPSEDMVVSLELPRTPKSCYPLQQMVRELHHYAADVMAEPVADLRDFDDDQCDQLRLVANDVAATCGRICTRSCRLSDIVRAEQSPLDVPLDISPTDEQKLLLVRDYLQRLAAPEPETDDEYELYQQSKRRHTARYVEDVVTNWLDVCHSKFSADDAEGYTRPTIEEGCYLFLHQLTEMNLHITNVIIGRLHEASLSQQHGQIEAVRAHFGFVLDDPTQITTNDIINSLIGANRDWHFWMNLKAEPKGTY